MKMLLFLLFTLSTAHAATSGTLTLSGTIATVVSVAITPQVGYNALNLAANATNQVVASVNESSNNPLGYKVKLSSANAGKLVNGSNQFTYTARYDSVAVTLSTTPQVVTNVASQSSTVSVNKNVDVSFTGSSSLMAGTYTDTLTVAIEAN